MYSFSKFCMPYVYSRPYVYSFWQIFQALRLFPALRLFRTLEYAHPLLSTWGKRQKSNFSPKEDLKAVGNFRLFNLEKAYLETNLEKLLIFWF